MSLPTTRLNLLARSLLTGQVHAAGDPHRPLWHLAPAVGLLNDPNGFIHFQGHYHLFYQWNPLACAHGAKFWGHWRSTDLVNWQHEPVALVPGDDYDSHGCYSGSAVDDHGTLTLIYTGNVKYPDGGRTAWQCLARAREDGTYDKLGPVYPLPAGYTGHVRDPKVWFEDGQWWMVLAAQDPQLQGKVLLLSSPDLQQWHNCGELAGSRLNGLGDFGYMWECPDLFRLDGQAILLTCPQGLMPQAEQWLNRFQCGWFAGDLDLQAVTFRHGDFHELDAGFEFYAPQTTETADGRRLLFGWMGVPEQDETLHPTLAYGWVHIMTCPRELHVEHGWLYQRPARELVALRGEKTGWQGNANRLPALPMASAELQITPRDNEPFCLTLGDSLWLEWDGQRLILSRPSLKDGHLEYRYWRGALQHLQLLCDRSSVEIFINHGQAVMSSRYFPASTATAITLAGRGSTELVLQHWPLSACVIE